MFVTVAGLGLFTAGCLGAADDTDAQVVDALPSDMLIDPNTHTGTNGLSTTTFHAYKGNLLTSMTQQLIVSGSLNSSINTSMCGGSAQAKMFGYAMACALPTGSSLLCNGDLYNGDPMLSTTSDWLNPTGLGLSAKNDVMACVATHVNAYNLTVPILLSGENIKKDNNGFGDFTFPEAIWTASTAAGSVIINVWPSAELSRFCGDIEYAADSIKFRICGINPSACQLNTKTDYTECTAAPGVVGTYTCNGQPAIQSWLSTAGRDALHAACQIH